MKKLKKDAVEIVNEPSEVPAVLLSWPEYHQNAIEIHPRFNLDSVDCFVLF